MSEILIRGAASVVTMDGTRREIAGGDVLLRDGVIADIDVAAFDDQRRAALAREQVFGGCQAIVFRRQREAGVAFRHADRAAVEHQHRRAELRLLEQRADFVAAERTDHEIGPFGGGARIRRGGAGGRSAVCTFTSVSR